MQDMPPRRRRWPTVLIALVLVLAGGWSGALVSTRPDRAETVIAGWRAREAKAGRIHTCGSQTVGGFPFRFEMRCARSRASS